MAVNVKMCKFLWNAHIKKKKGSCCAQKVKINAGIVTNSSKMDAYF